MVDNKTFGKLRAKLSRRHSAAPSLSASGSSKPSSQEAASLKSSSSAQGRPSAEDVHATCPDDAHHHDNGPEAGADVTGRQDVNSSHPSDSPHGTQAASSTMPVVTGPLHSDQPRAVVDANGNDQRPQITRLQSINEHPSPAGSSDQGAVVVDNSQSTTEDSTTTDEESNDDKRDHHAESDLATPIARPAALAATPNVHNNNPTHGTSSSSPVSAATAALRQSPFSPRSATAPRRPVANRQNTLLRALLGAAQGDDTAQAGLEQLLPITGNMTTRKIWVKRPAASATLVTIHEDDVVDDVREMILRKYANSLGRQFDAPDLTLYIIPRELRQERQLGPEEPMARTLDAYYPGGQSVDEALIVDIPQRRTPRASPRMGPPHAAHLTSAIYDELRPSEGGTDYFGPSAVSTAHLPVTVPVPIPGAPAANAHPHAISVLSTGHVPQIPSPGGTRSSRPYRDRPDRPRLGRQHTSSPTILNTAAIQATMVGGPATSHGVPSSSQNPRAAPRSRTHSSGSSDQNNSTVAAGQAAPPPAAPPLPSPPAQETAPILPAPAIQRVATPPPPRVASPRPTARPKKKKTALASSDSGPAAALSGGMMNGAVPPINVLIVEDNIINLKLLEAFVKRLKVRWQTAMNGREAVNKWRTGGFHLVLMDIQLPVMSGLEATREIRRLERVNSIGVFSEEGKEGEGESEGGSEKRSGELDEADKLTNTEMFKSSVIIVALTASSLQSDRHQALAAGCNDFLTKPVNFVWLERKVMEWGCMQALIDFDGWRKWKDFSQKAQEAEIAKKAAPKAKTKKTRQSVGSSSAA